MNSMRRQLSSVKHNTYNWILRIYTLLLLFGIPVALGIHAYFHQPRCIIQSTVKKILDLDYRSATILLSTGEKVVVNQATLKPGDSYCAKWQR